MINRNKTILTSVFFLALLSSPLTNIANASSLGDKLKECKQEFAIAHSGSSTQKIAAAAKLKHLKLMKEILQELNNKNAGKKMTNSELQENVMVMSHLLEMLVTENLNQKEESWNMNY